MIWEHFKIKELSPNFIVKETEAGDEIFRAGGSWNRYFDTKSRSNKYVASMTSEQHIVKIKYNDFNNIVNMKQKYCIVGLTTHSPKTAAYETHRVLSSDERIYRVHHK